jgi:DNA-binding response OmpR family regulator
MVDLTQKNKVLVVDDEAAIVRALSDKLIREGFEVVQATNGEEGLQVAYEHRPALILLDILMPKMDGLTMLKKLREDPWGKYVPVIVLTSLDSDEKAMEAVNDLAYDYLLKKETNIEDIIGIIKEKLKI